MTYYGGKELAAAFRTVRGNTLRIAEEIPEEKYGFRPAEGSRSVAELLAHIAFATTFNEQINIADRRSNMEGFDFMGFMGPIMAEQNKPRTKAELIAVLKERGENFARKLESLDEKFFAESITFPAGANPPSRTRFDLLLGAKEHEMHHRGQLMLIERLIGIKPHLTREAEARMAAMQAQAAQK